MVSEIKDKPSQWVVGIILSTLALVLLFSWVKDSTSNNGEPKKASEENRLKAEDVTKAPSTALQDLKKKEPLSVEEGKAHVQGQANLEKVVKPQIITYIVESGDNPWTIAKKFNLDVDTILGANGLGEKDNLKIGQELKILPFKGVIHKVASGENLWTIARAYQIEIGDILDHNDIEDEGESLKIGQEILLPGAKLRAPSNGGGFKEGKVKSGKGSQKALKERLSLPTRGTITSRFGMRWGRMHQGVDIGAPMGQNIYASKSGKVVYSGWRGNYGNLVIIDHGSGLSTYYAHNSKNLVRRGDRVSKGDVIAKVGSTGRSTGPHVHFEVRVNGQPVNPLKKVK